MRRTTDPDELIGAFRTSAMKYLSTLVLTGALAGQGSPFAVRGDGIPQAALAEARTLLEAAWPAAMALFGADGAAPLGSCSVRIHRTAAGYAAAEQELTRGLFARNLAFTHWDTRIAHVAVQPDLGDEALARLGCGFQTLRLVVHEATHLARARAFASFRFHPDWLADGAASHVETLVLAAAGLLSSPEADPTFATATLRAQRLLARTALPGVAALLDGEGDELDFYDRYAVRWCLFRFLAEAHGDALARALDDLRRFGAGPDVPRRLRKALVRRLGEAAAASLDADFRAFVVGLAPQWEQEGRWLETAGEDWVQAAFDDSDAVAWRTPAVDGRAAEITGAVTILPDGADELRLLLGRGAAGHLAVAFTAAGTVRVLEVGDGATVVRAEQHAPNARAARTAFRIAAGAGRVQVEIEGRPALDAGSALALPGAWGLSAIAGSTGIWHDIRVGAR